MARNIHSDWCAEYSEAVNAYLRYSGMYGNEYLEIELLPHDDECWLCMEQTAIADDEEVAS